MRIPVTNNTNMPIYVGANMIPPGETRDFEEHDVPLHLRPKAPEPVKASEPEKTELELLREQSVKDIVSAFENMSDEQLGELEAAEKAAEEPRKTLLEAIAAETLKRAGGE